MPTAIKEARARVSLAPLPSLEDADLVRRARDGDELAFEEIVRRYRQPLIRYSARHVGQANAEDITQHALASCSAHLRDDPRPIHLRAWLYRVAHNAAINMRARKDFGHEELSLEIDGVPQPPEVAAQRSEVRQVVSELDRLPDRQRTALLLSVFEGLGYDEIAARLDTSPNSVRALLSRARVHLRKAAAAIAPLPLLQSLDQEGVRPRRSGRLQPGQPRGRRQRHPGEARGGRRDDRRRRRRRCRERRIARRRAGLGSRASAPSAVSVAPTHQTAVPLDIDHMLPHVAPPPPAKDEAGAAAEAGRR